MTTWTEEQYDEHLIKRKKPLQYDEHLIKHKKPLRIVGQKDGEAVVEPAEPAPDVLEMVAPENQQKRRRNKQIEMQEQTLYFSWIDKAISQGKLGADLIFSVPNGTTANPTIGRMMVRSGVRKGVPDVFIAAPKMIGPIGEAYYFGGCFLEFKQPSGVLSDVSKEQREWHERLREAGYKVAVVFGFHEAKRVTENYLGWKDSS